MSNINVSWDLDANTATSHTKASIVRDAVQKAKDAQDAVPPWASDGEEGFNTGYYEGMVAMLLLIAPTIGREILRGITE